MRHNAIERFKWRLLHEVLTESLLLNVFSGLLDSRKSGVAFTLESNHEPTINCYINMAPCSAFSHQVGWNKLWAFLVKDTFVVSPLLPLFKRSPCHRHH